VLNKPAAAQMFVILKDHGSTSLARAKPRYFSVTRSYYMHSLFHLGAQNVNTVGLELLCMCAETSAKYLGYFNADL
jgi:hypothetical protein